MKGRGRAIAAAIGARARPHPWPGLSLGLSTLPARLSHWAGLEIERGRAFLFLPVTFGAGILLYFAAPDEPTLWAPALSAAGLGLLALRLRDRHAAALCALGLAAVAGGFATAALKARLVGEPLLAETAGRVQVRGWVESVERREGGDRLVVQVVSLDPRPAEAPGRIRVTSRAKSRIEVGQAVAFAARLRPAAEAVAPGHYDFARDAFFAGLGAGGFVIGAVTAWNEAGPPPPAVRARAAVATLREAISARIRGAIPGTSGAIADALVTGKRDGIPEGLNEAMRAAGTYHILSISGFHMALVAALVFALVRGGLALVPALALRHHVKAWAALVALAVATGYLVISGAEVATQRSWIMIAVVLVGVALDRGALTLRTLALAALLVLVVAPESLLGPSFQMSFAATLALVSGYVALRPWAEHHAADPAGFGRSVLLVTNGVAGLAMSSFLASLATTPYAAFHFNAVHAYGVAGNLLGAPIVEFLVMPLEIAALLLWPFGWDRPVWILAGLAIDLFVRVVEWVASWPGGRVTVATIRPSGLILLSLGLILAGILSTPLRWIGAPVFALGLWIAPVHERALILIDAEGRSVAARAPDGLLRRVSPQANRFAVERWLQSEGDSRRAAEDSVTEGVRCDPSGCAMPLAGGGRIAVPRLADAVADDCREARIVVTRFPAPPGCLATVVDLNALAWSGAVRIHAGAGSPGAAAAGGLTAETARPAASTRPWHRPRPAGPRPDLIRMPAAPPGQPAARPADSGSPQSRPDSLLPPDTDLDIEPAQ